MAKCCQNVSIYLPGKDHLCHFERGVVSDPASFDDRLFDAEFVRELAQLFAATMNDADANASLVEQRQLLRQRNQVLMTFCNFAGEFYDKRVSFKALNVRQRFPQEIQAKLIVNRWMCLTHCSTFSPALLS